MVRSVVESLFPAHGVVAELEGIVSRLREVWPQVRITVRGVTHGALATVEAPLAERAGAGKARTPATPNCRCWTGRGEC